MKSKIKKLLKKIAILAIIIYVGYVFIGQQQTLNSYATEKEYYNQLIEEKEKEKDELLCLKENINSPEYIEQLSREKLDMYLPNERVYIDINK